MKTNIKNQKQWRPSGIVNLIAESDDTIVIETTHYFPADSIKTSIFP